MSIVKVVCMGDSITEGFGIGWEDATYPSRLGWMLGEGYQVINKGVSGTCVVNTTLGGMPVGMPYVKEERYKEALMEKGDIYIIILGTNDAKVGRDETTGMINPNDNPFAFEPEFDRYFQDILDAVKEAAPKALIYVGIPIPVMECIWPAHQETYLRKIMPHYHSIKRKNPGVRLIDLHTAFSVLTEQERAKMYQPDGLHPNDRGAMLIAKTVEKVLRCG